MKFFTLDWWRGQTEGDAGERYRDYYDSIKDLLPASVCRLEEAMSLHDGKLLRMDADVGAGTLLIVLDGYDFSRRQSPLPERTITLRYSGVRWLRSVADPTKGALQGPAGYGDLG